MARRSAKQTHTDVPTACYAAYLYETTKMWRAHTKNITSNAITSDSGSIEAAMFHNSNNVSLRTYFCPNQDFVPRSEKIAQSHEGKKTCRKSRELVRKMAMRMHIHTVETKTSSCKNIDFFSPVSDVLMVVFFNKVNVQSEIGAV